MSTKFTAKGSSAMFQIRDQGRMEGRGESKEWDTHKGEIDVKHGAQAEVQGGENGDHALLF